MKSNHEKSYQPVTAPKSTTLNLQTRAFAPTQLDSSQVNRQSEETLGKSKASSAEDLLGKLISNLSNSSSSANLIQRKLQRHFPVQAKLNIGEPNDKYEKEADDTAAKVVQQINSSPQDQSVQRNESMEKEDEELQMKSSVQSRENIGGGEASTDLESSIQSARGSGQPLDQKLQTKMGQVMGADFSGVKVHTDLQSDQLNKSIQAKAFTTGQDVFFQQGAYNPSSRDGQDLIAHELTHVVQQNGGSVQRQMQQGISTMSQKPFIQKTEDHAKQIASLYDPEETYDDWESISKAKKNFLPYQWDILLAAVNLDESGKPQLWDRLGNKVDESPLNKEEQAVLDKKMQELDRLDEEIDLEDLEMGLKGIHKNILLYLEGTIRDRLGNGGVAQFYKGAHIILKDNGAVYEEVKRLGMPIAAFKQNGDIKSKTEFVGKTGTNYGGLGSDTAEQRSGKMFTRRPENSETSHYQPNIVDDKDKPLPYKDQGWGYGWGLRGTYYEKKNIGYDSNIDTVKPQLGIDLPESVKGHILVGIVPPHLGDESKNDAVGHTFVQTEGAGFQNFNEASLAHGQGFLANVGVTAKKGTQTGLVGKTLHSEKTTQEDLDKNSDARAEIREQDQHPLQWDWDTLYSEALEYALQHSEVY